MHMRLLVSFPPSHLTIYVACHFGQSVLFVTENDLVLLFGQLFDPHRLGTGELQLRCCTRGSLFFLPPPVPVVPAGPPVRPTGDLPPPHLQGNGRGGKGLVGHGGARGKGQYLETKGAQVKEKVETAQSSFYGLLILGVIFFANGSCFLELCSPWFLTLL